MESVRLVSLSEIDAGAYNVRAAGEDESLGDLARSIGREGLLNPLTVVERDGRYIVVAGHRRFEACRMAGVTRVLVCVVAADEQGARAIALAENLERKDMTPVETAAAMSEALERNLYTVPELASRMGRSIEWVRRMVALLEWPDDVLLGVQSGKISVAAASNLACITEVAYREHLVRCAMDSGATARTTAAWLQAWEAMKPADEAVTEGPVGQAVHAMPLLPEAPCFVCESAHRTDELSYVLICGRCMAEIRRAEPG
jgi:ParB family chromosome partitioning protein